MKGLRDRERTEFALTDPIAKRYWLITLVPIGLAGRHHTEFLPSPIRLGSPRPWYHFLLKVANTWNPGPAAGNTGGRSVRFDLGRRRPNSRASVSNGYRSDGSHQRHGLTVGARGKRVPLRCWIVSTYDADRPTVPNGENGVGYVIERLDNGSITGLDAWTSTGVGVDGSRTQKTIQPELQRGMNKRRAFIPVVRAPAVGIDLDGVGARARRNGHGAS